MQLDLSTRFILSARYSVGQIGFAAGEIAYLQAVHCMEEKLDLDSEQADLAEVHRSFYSHLLTVRIAGVLDTRRKAMSLHKLETTRGDKKEYSKIQAYADSHCKSANDHLSPAKFDDLRKSIAKLVRELRTDNNSFLEIKNFRDREVAHNTLESGHTVSFCNFKHVVWDLIQIGDKLQYLMKGGVDGRDFIGLYMYEFR